MNAKKNEKCEKGASSPPPTERCGGLAVAGGEVRRGKPSGTVRKNAIIQNHAKHPVGVRRIEDASVRPPHPRMACPADGVAQSVLGVYA